MKTRNLITALTLTILFAASMCVSPLPSARGQMASNGPCSIEIISLKEGDKVGRSVTVRGKATIPTDGYLWLLSKKSSLGNQWWPQPGGPIETRKGEWEAEVFFGRPEDIDSNFDVAAVVVSRQTSAELTKWFSTAQKLDYPPVAFPNTNSSCSVVTVKVVKVS
jgi:hypothetical protein